MLINQLNFREWAAARTFAVRRVAVAVWLLATFLTPSAARAAEVPGQVPLLDGGDMILVPVHAFNKTLYFIADTGFTTTAIDSRYESFLGPQIDSYNAVSPLGTKKDVPVYACPEISIAGEPLGLAEVIKLDLTMLQQITGKPCDGILGMDWFAKNVVAINFDNQTLSLAAPPAAMVKESYVPVVVEETNGFYAMNVLVNGSENFNLMIDTGDSSSLSLNQMAWQEVFSTNEPKTSVVTVADAVNHVVQTKIGVVRELTVQGLQYTNLDAMYIKHPEHPSRLGLGFFRRHNVIFDFSGGRLYLQPDYNFAAVDAEDMSGLHLLRVGGKTVVYAVDDHSPAAVAGIAAKDMLETVNNQSAGALTMNSIRQILRSGNGDQVALRVERGARSFEVQIILRKTI